MSDYVVGGLVWPEFRFVFSGCHRLGDRLMTEIPAHQSEPSEVALVYNSHTVRILISVEGIPMNHHEPMGQDTGR